MGGGGFYLQTSVNHWIKPERFLFGQKLLKIYNPRFPRKNSLLSISQRKKFPFFELNSSELQKVVIASNEPPGGFCLHQ